jgi:APA family basic amino acid/polyamine antiporter
MEMAVTRNGTATPGLRRELGGWTTTAVVVGNMIGSGVFLLPAALAVVALEYGSGSLLAWVVTGIGAMMLAGVFASLGRAYPRTGGPYVYARQAFGDFMGFQTAWGYWIAAWVGNAAIATAFVGALAVFIPLLGEGTTAGHLWAYATAIGTIWLLTLINAWGVKQTGAVQLVTTILKFVPLVLIGIVGLFFMDTGNFGGFAPNGYGTGTGLIGGITAAMALTLWAFIGLESATVPAEEVRSPARTIPRATIWGTLVTAVLYAVATIAVMGIVPLATLRDSSAPFADAATEVFGGAVWGKVVALVVMISTFGALNGWILLQGRVPYAAARDGLFPKAFGKLSRSGTPVFGLVVSSILITGLMALNYHKDLVDNFTFVILLATLVTLVPYAFSAAAEAHLMITDRTAFVGRRFLRDIAVAALAFAYAVWTMVGSGMEIIGQGFVLWMLGVPVFIWMRWTKRHEHEAIVPYEHPMIVAVDGKEAIRV